MLLKNEIDDILDCSSGRWKDQIVFSPKDIAAMMNLPISSIWKLCREGKLECFKVKKSYRVPRKSLYSFILKCIEDSIVL